MVSIVIPSRNEKYLQKTIDTLLEKAEGEIEIIAILDGYWPNPIIKDDPRVKLIHRSEPLGMRAAINAGVDIAQGEFIMKCDAHCLFDQGYDVKLTANCEDNWVVVPRRKRLDVIKWDIQDVGKPDVDYMFLSYPNNPGDWGGPGLHGREWTERNRNQELKSIMIDDLMSAQGSCWFMKKNYYRELELLDDANYGTFAQEFQEIGLKCWLSGGRVVVNKNTWYAHWHKGKVDGRGYYLSKNDLNKAVAYSNRWMTEKMWHKQIYDVKWLIKKFWPVPGWPEEYGK